MFDPIRRLRGRVLLGMLVAAGLWAGSTAGARAEEVKLTILHTSDFHGRFEQMLKVGPLFRQVQAETGRAILLDAGNAFSPSEDAFVRADGQKSLTIALLNREGYHALTLGPEDLQQGTDRLNGFLQEASFSVLGANLHRPETGRNLFQVQPYTVVHLGGLSVGVLGLSAGGPGVAMGNPVLAARYYVPMLRHAAQVVVLLTNLGFEADSTLAASVPGIDAIAGRNVRRVLDGPRTVNGVLINHAGVQGSSVGRIDLTLSDGHVTSEAARLIPLDVAVSGADDEDAALAGWTAMVDGDAKPLTARLGTCGEGFGPPQNGASAMGYLIADVVRSATQADVALISASNVNPVLTEGTIRVLDLYRIYPAPHQLVVFQVTGRKLKEILEEGPASPESGFYPSGLEVVYDRSLPQGQRVASLKVGGKPVVPDQSYRLVVEQDVAGRLGISGGVQVGVRVRDLLARHIRTAGMIQGTVDGRVQVR